MRHTRIREGAANHARPLELVGLEGGGRADIRLRIEAAGASFWKNLAHGSHDGRIQVL